MISGRNGTSKIKNIFGNLMRKKTTSTWEYWKEKKKKENNN